MAAKKRKKAQEIETDFYSCVFLRFFAANTFLVYNHGHNTRACPEVLVRPFLATFGLFAFVVIGRTQPKSEPLFTLSGHGNEVNVVAWSPDGTKIASGSNSEVKIWDAATGKATATYQAKSSHVYGIAFSPDSKRIAVGISKLVKILDSSDGKELLSINTCPNTLFRLIYSPDGKYIAAANGNQNNSGDVRVWDAATGDERHCLTGHSESPLNVAFSGDGRFLVSSTGSVMATKAGEIKIWDFAAGRDIRTLRGHTENVYGVSVSGDGRRIASASGVKGGAVPGFVKLWEVASRKVIADLEGHTGPLYNVLFSPDGRRLATSSGDRTIRIWDVSSAKLLLSITAHDSAVYGLAFSPDGLKIVSSGVDRSVKVWDVSKIQAPVSPVRVPQTEDELRTSWTDLSGDDAGRAFRAIAALATASDRAVSFLSRHIHPVPALTAESEKQAVAWIAELGSGKFALREKAGLGLSKLGEGALPLLREAANSSPSPEVRKRVARLLESLEEPTESPAYLANLRGLEVLERIGTPSAHSMLRLIAAGVPGANLTVEAQAALARLSRKPTAP